MQDDTKSFGMLRKAITKKNLSFAENEELVVNLLSYLFSRYF